MFKCVFCHFAWDATCILYLVGGFNPFEKYQSNWKPSPNRGEHKKIFETTTYRYFFNGSFDWWIHPWGICSICRPPWGVE